MDADSPTDVRLTDTQLGILTALCRPISAGNHFATPATNQEIADEVFLSVDAVKGHLRTLYRKFGIEDLPHNQKRARLVELAIEGGYIETAAPEGAPDAEEPAPETDEGRAPAADATPPAPERVRTSPEHVRESANAAGPRRRHRMLIGVGGVLILAAILAAVLAIAGVFSSGSSEAGAPTPEAFRAQVAGYCELALAGAPSTSDGSRVERAQGYLEVIETMRGRFESLPRPAEENLALTRFGAGLTNAAEYTSDVAEGPPPAGSPAEAKAVAELTFAAGQVQAGALGYGLGQDCSAIGDLVARSAENAAAP